MPSSKPTLKLLPKARPATVQEIAQIEFRALKFLRGLSQSERIEKIHNVIDRLRPLAVLSSSITAMTKPELIAKVEEGYETFGPFLMLL
jgi:hypothetical protein